MKQQECQRYQSKAHTASLHNSDYDWASCCNLR